MASKRKSKKTKAKAVTVTVPLYLFDFDNDETYEPTETERERYHLAWSLRARKGKLSRVVLMEWKRHLVEAGHDQDEIKALTFSQALELTQYALVSEVIRRSQGTSTKGGWRNNRRAFKSQPVLTSKRSTEPMTKPLFPKQWAVVFGVSASTMRRWKKSGVYSFDPVSPRKWRLPLSEVPAEYLQKYQKLTQSERS